MNNSPFISVITPTFNAAQTLIACIESVASQTYPYFEHWIIDGLSTDNTMEIVKEYASKYTHLKYVSEKDTGIYNAMNKGISLSKGDWLYFLGADDRLYGNSVLSDIFEKSINEDIGVIVGDIIINFANHTHSYKSTKFDKYFFAGESIYHQAILMSKKVFEVAGNFDESYKICADTKMEYEAFRFGFQYLYVDIIIASYSGTGISSDSKYIDLTRNERVRIIQHIFETCTNNEKKILADNSKKFIKIWLSEVLSYGLGFYSIYKSLVQTDKNLKKAFKRIFYNKNFWLANSSESGAFTNLQKGSILIGLLQVFFLCIKEKRFFYYLKNSIYWLKVRFFT
ncbi:glycosyltransferase family 2 protein [Thermoflexibacter ruber]|uniref:Glycosyltransferase involved in cell wall bisynthesis n=1 Tax=Thermoflexibacter ruber TaxID=1003 RepID=A0A1I2E8Y2_9BACT|nr:glycosyltransferase family 2 protein [Thermoflexibacter ruber]SFE88941.1 Glycosyltransferase involved in cell wall bisynthesis [Thermoflexibacter ruber]